MPPPASHQPAPQPSLQEILHTARELTSGTAYGLLCTVDAQGCPRARWMACVTQGNFDQLLALTAITSRKVAHIRTHPEVQWVFTHPDMSRVITFTGHARILDHVEDVKRSWNRIPDKTRAYFLHGSLSGLGVAVIETSLDTLEFSVPSSNILVSIDLATVRTAPPPNS
ncbi:MAG: pyridoxamine 5'-phosphate oxidase family protein [Verrucomicrobiia bacterium]